MKHSNNIAWHFPFSCNLQVIYKTKGTIWKQNRQFTIGEVSKKLSKSKLPNSCSRTRKWVERSSGKPLNCKCSVLWKSDDLKKTPKLKSPTSHATHEASTL